MQMMLETVDDLLQVVWDKMMKKVANLCMQYKKLVCCNMINIKKRNTY
jgi:hypothetical protein